MEVPESPEQIGKFVPTSSAFPFKKFTVTNDWEEKKRTVITTEILDSGKKEITTTIHDFSKEEERTVITTEIRDPEEERMIHQARLAHRLRRELTRKVLVEGKSSSDGKSSTPDTPTPLFGMTASAELQKHENQTVIARATGVSLLHYPFGSFRGFGTLDAYINRFTYTSYGFRTVIENANVDGCFCLKNLQFPLMQFHLKHAIMVDKQETNDILFCFENQFDWLNSFIYEVKATLWTYRGQVPITPIYFEMLDEFSFDGVLPTGKEAIFALTYSALLMLDAEPSTQLFDVVPLDDIEIVNLSLLEPGWIHMAVVFKDFKCTVLEIHSVPLMFLPDIKKRLNSADVKYYVNSEKRDWNDSVRKISESPETFIRDGGWESLHLEDDRTLAYYPDADSGSDSEKFGTSLC